MHVVASFLLICLHAFVQGSHSLQYSDLKDMGISCPKEHTCDGIQENSKNSSMGCECDLTCDAYGDCCIGAGRHGYRSEGMGTQRHIPTWVARQKHNAVGAETERYKPAWVQRQTSIQAAPTGVECLKYGGVTDPAIYAVSKCNNTWNGPIEVKRKCEGPTDSSDPFTDAPLTSTSRAVTYKNLHCAECNNADLESLRPFLYALSCKTDDGRLDDMSDEQLMDQLSYDKEKEMWILNRGIDERTSYIIECGINFFMPGDLENHVRFCRANIISKCAPDWNRRKVAKLCDEYMAVVYHGKQGYRNPHCAICNKISVSELSCMSATGFGRGLPLARLIDLNYKKSPSCSPGQKYDPFSKKCRTLRCAFPGYVVIEDKCVPGE